MFMQRSKAPSHMTVNQPDPRFESSETLYKLSPFDGLTQKRNRGLTCAPAAWRT